MRSLLRAEMASFARGNGLFSATEAGSSDEVALARGNGLFSASEAGSSDEVALARGNCLLSATEASCNDEVALARGNPRPRPAAMVRSGLPAIENQK